MKSLFIIDTMSIIFKAYYAMIRNPLYSPSGFPTSAIYGFFNQFLKILEIYKPEYLVLAYDAKEKTFRHEQYEAYKSSRVKIPEDLIPQIEKIKEIIEFLKIPSIIKPGYEADDIIGSLTNYFSSQNIKCYILSPDKDLLQLINQNTFVIRSLKSFDEFKLYDFNKFLDEFGFEPQYIVDYLALIGDSSDDIPGVKGLGEKSVSPLIKEYHTIENIYNNIDKLSPSIQKKLIENKDNAFLSKQLATIKKDLQIDNYIENYRLTKVDITKVIEIFNELNIKSLKDKIISNFSKNIISINSSNHFSYNQVKIHPITTKDELKKFINKLPLVISLTIKNKYNKNFITNIETINISFGQNNIYQIQNDTNTDLFGNSLNKNSINIDDIRYFFEIINVSSTQIVTDCSKSLFHCLNFLNLKPKMRIFDISIAHYLIDPEISHDIDDIIKEYIDNDYQANSIPQILYFQNLLALLLNRLVEKNLINLYNELEIPLSYLLAKIEQTGIKIDTNIIEELKTILYDNIKNTENKIYELANQEFNINSTKQLGQILFEHLKLTPVSKTKTGYSTDAQALEELRSAHPIIEHIILYRTFTKLLNTYVEALPKHICEETGKIHAQFNQTLASTGRISISNPNLQNIPIRSDIGKEVRKTFVAFDTSSELLSADYSQIELRILAHFSQDKVLQYAFENNLDIHSQTASEIFNININDVDTNMRRAAKTINFGIIYGLGPYGLKTRLGISSSEAKDIINQYFKKFTGIYDYIEETKKFAKSNGYTETLLGRRRYFKNINSKNKVVASYEERAAINHPIQGTAADIIKKAMIEINKFIEENNLRSRIILQIHDELLFNVPNNEIEIVQTAIKQLMETTITLNIPLIVEIGKGKNWFDAH